MKVKNIEISNPNFRPKTFTEVKEWVFTLMMGKEKTAALGDMICWMSAIKYVAEQFNFVQGHLIVPSFFMEIAQNLMREYPHWRIHTKIPDRLANGFPIKAPMMHPVNATAVHLVDLGYLYFAGMMPPEGFGQYPVLDLSDLEMPPHLSELLVIGAYAVMTPGATTKNRAMPPSVYNGICDHLLTKGITPVHIGTSQMEYREIQPQMNAQYDFSKGINLIDKTSLLEAALIMSDARMVIGIDNGLLHLAAMTDTTILFGYTVAGPRTRQIRRPHGHTIELYADKEKLPCLFCQENVRFFMDHHFTNCIYKENEPACIKALNVESWNASIDMALGENNG